MKIDVLKQSHIFMTGMTLNGILAFTDKSSFAYCFDTYTWCFYFDSIWVNKI